MKRFLCAALILAILVLPGLGLTEGADTIRLAKTLYILGKGESYETMLDLGTVVMNRVESPWYPDTVMGVLNQSQQFPCGTLYDEESLKAARAVMMGQRTLPADVVCYSPLDATHPLRADTLYSTRGAYGFYTMQ